MHVRTPSVGTLGGLQTVPPVVAGPCRERRKPKPMMHGLKKSDGVVGCAGQRPNQVGSSPTGARVRGAISKSGGHSSLAGVSDFLGFTHFCTETRRGRFRLGRKPVAKRVTRTLARIEEVLRNRRHHDIWEVGMWLGRVVNGWSNYFAVPGSTRWLRTFRQRLQRLWLRAIRRRSQRHRFDWKRLERMTELLWPRASIRHPWPDQRFTVKHPR